MNGVETFCLMKLFFYLPNAVYIQLYIYLIL